MSVYHLMPSPDIAGKEETHAYWENGFSQSEISSLVTYGDRLIKLSGQSGTTGSGEVTPDVRKSLVSWIDYNDNTQWIYDKLGYIVRQLNGQYFQYDIAGFSEHFQYTVYNGNDQAFYDWHIDKGYANGAGLTPRKLSMVVQLSDPSEYEGGELQLMTGVGIDKKKAEDGSSIIEQVFGDGVTGLSKTQGIVHVFPSWVIHRVTPVTRGTRRSLVVWVCGPKFR